MPTLPTRFAPFILAFSHLFRQRTWRHAELLIIGAILAPGIRTVASVLRIMGAGEERHFCDFHRVLSRARWSPLAASRILLTLIVRAFASEGPIILGIDDTIERRRGKHISARGIYRDAVRSSRSYFVKTEGLRWLSLMLLSPIPWARRVWALPFLTTLAPSERYASEHGLRHKRLTDRARQLALQARRWLPGRELVLVADNGFAALELLRALAPHMTCITRLRLDAQLHAFAPPREAGKPGRPLTKGARLPKLSAIANDLATAAATAAATAGQRWQWQRVTIHRWYGEEMREIEFLSGTALWYHKGMPTLPVRWVLLRDPMGHFEPQALLSTTLDLDPLEIIKWYTRRWQVEVTFEEAHRHLGFETQRQWSDLAIARTTPVILALFSLITLLAHELTSHGTLAVRGAAWYRKSTPTFSDALAEVRVHFWRARIYRISPSGNDVHKPPPALRETLALLTEALCRAA